MGRKLAEGVSRKRDGACKILFNIELRVVFMRRNGMAMDSFGHRESVSDCSHVGLCECLLAFILTSVFTMCSGVGQ